MSYETVGMSFHETPMQLHMIALYLGMDTKQNKVSERHSSMCSAWDYVFGSGEGGPVHLPQHAVRQGPAKRLLIIYQPYLCLT